MSPKLNRTLPNLTFVDIIDHYFVNISFIPSFPILLVFLSFWFLVSVICQVRFEAPPSSITDQSPWSFFFGHRSTIIKFFFLLFNRFFLFFTAFSLTAAIVEVSLSLFLVHHFFFCASRLFTVALSLSPSRWNAGLLSLFLSFILSFFRSLLLLLLLFLF